MNTELVDTNFDFNEGDLEGLSEPFDPDKVSPARLRSPLRRGAHYPLVLAHGIARPDHLVDSLARRFNISLYDFRLLSDRFHYFRGIASYLRRHEFTVYHSSVSFAAGVETRARDLQREINRILQTTGAAKVHLIAHSMGGLDARHAIVDLGMADKVASLTTIGTPHLGCAIADRVIDFGAEKLIAAFRWLIDLEGIKSVTTAACRAFNERARNAEATNGVVYQTYASHQSLEKTFLPFRLSWKVIYENEGDNDGLVSANSQRWHKLLISDDGWIKVVKQRSFPFLADHLDQMGWWNVNELHKAGWWNLNARRRRFRRESRIKRIYLRIAQEISEIV